jgi:hypothetical protein
MNTRHTLTVASLCLAAVGALLLFAPDEVSEAFVATPRGGAIAQMCGAGLFGFAAMNWTARGSAIGGIYGRAVVIGNQTHLMIGALLLISRGIDQPRNLVYWVIAGLYIGGALYFSYLAFFSSGVRPQKAAARDQ